MKSSEQARPVYEATLYYDAPENAADDQRDLGYFPSVQSAAAAINEARDPADGRDEGWFTGGIRYGFLHPAKFGVRPQWFESDDRESPWFVGTDGRVDR